MVQTAIRIVVREAQRKRVKTIFEPLLTAVLTHEQRVEAERQWHRLVEAAFDMPTPLGVAVLKKFIHQVKCKRLWRPVKRHLMPVIQREVQGAGKTTFELKLTEPLQ